MGGRVRERVWLWLLNTELGLNITDELYTYLVFGRLCVSHTTVCMEPKPPFCMWSAHWDSFLVHRIGISCSVSLFWLDLSPLSLGNAHVLLLIWSITAQSTRQTRCFCPTSAILASCRWLPLISVGHCMQVQLAKDAAWVCWASMLPSCLGNIFFPVTLWNS